MTDKFTVPVLFPYGLVDVPAYYEKDGWKRWQDGALPPVRLVPCHDPDWRFIATSSGWVAEPKRPA